MNARAVTTPEPVFSLTPLSPYTPFSFARGTSRVCLCSQCVCCGGVGDNFKVNHASKNEFFCPRFSQQEMA